MSALTAQSYLDAMRLAMEAGSDDSSVIRLIGELLDKAPEGDPQDKESVRAFVDAIRALEATVKVLS